LRRIQPCLSAIAASISETVTQRGAVTRSPVSSTKKPIVRRRGLGLARR
jgi:hypothetical protein